MNKKKKISIAILILAIIVALVAGYLYVFNKGGEDITVRDFFPFGRGDDSSLPSDDQTQDDFGSEGDDTDTQDTPPQRPSLLQISTAPSAGATVISTTEDQQSNTVRYVERATGHIFDFDLTTLSERKISNTTIPKIHKALWTDNGEGVILRYLKDSTGSLETFYAKLIANNDESSGALFDLEGNFFPVNITTISLSPDAGRVFYMVNEGTGDSTRGVGYISKTDTTSRAPLHSSPLTQWVSEWPTQSEITLTTKASAGVPGALRIINTSTGANRGIPSRAEGLTTLTSPDGSLILFSVSSGTQLSLGVYNADSQETLSSVSVNTLPEKCVWSVDSVTVYCAVPNDQPLIKYPDDWYQGKALFSDSIWKIDATTGQSERIANVSDIARQDIDVVDPNLDELEDLLLFRNKRDHTVWLLDLTSL